MTAEARGSRAVSSVGLSSRRQANRSPAQSTGERGQLREPHRRGEPRRRDVGREQEVGQVADREQQRRHVGDEDADQDVRPGRHLEPLHRRDHQRGEDDRGGVQGQDDGDQRPEHQQIPQEPRPAPGRAGGQHRCPLEEAARLEQGGEEEQREQEQQRLARHLDQRPDLPRVHEPEGNGDGRRSARPPPRGDAPWPHHHRHQRRGEQNEGQNSSHGWNRARER